MGRPAGWMKALTGRSAMKSPGAPSHQRETQRKFWRVIAAGVTSEAAAERVGVAPAVGCRWFRHGGGMPPISLAEPSVRFLRFAEREEVAMLRAQHLGVREIARRLSRSPSTISRELRRNAATRCGKLEYRASVRSGRPSWSRNDQRPRSWSPIHSFAATCRIGWQEALAAETERRWLGHEKRHGGAATSHTVAIVAGPRLEPRADISAPAGSTSQ